MKQTKRFLAILLAVVMVLPMAVVTSFAEGEVFLEDNWTLFGAHYYNDKLIGYQYGANGFTMSANQDGSITLTTPSSVTCTGQPISGRGALITADTVAMITNENPTALDNLSVTVKPGQNFTFNADNKNTSESISVAWTTMHPILLSDFEGFANGGKTVRETELKKLPMYSLDCGEFYGQCIRGLVPAAYTDETTGNVVAGTNGVIVSIANNDKAISNSDIATSVVIYKFDGSFADASDGRYGYRWTFFANNFAPQTGNANAYDLNSFEERIHTAEGVTFEFIPDTTLGYKVYVNGKAFSDGSQVGYFPFNNVFTNAGDPGGTISEGREADYAASMTAARADIDLTDLVGLGLGYVTIGTEGNTASTTTAYDIDIVAINGIPAAQWEGESNAHTHTWTTVVNEPSSCYVPSNKIQKCTCGAVKSNQFNSSSAVEPAITVQNEMHTLDQYYEDYDLPKDSAYEAKKTEILMHAYWLTTDAKQHHYVRQSPDPTPATCTSVGVADYVCEYCGDAKTEAVPALGHNWSNWTYNQDHTELTRTCSTCNTTETQAVVANGTYDDYWTVASRNRLTWLNTDPENLTYTSEDDDHYEVLVGANGELIVHDAAALGETVKLPITKAMTKYTSKLDGFTATVSNIQTANAKNYSLSFLWTNTPVLYDGADEYSTYKLKYNNFARAREGFFYHVYVGGESDLSLTLLDALWIDDNKDGIPNHTEGMFDGNYDVMMFAVIRDGVVVDINRFELTNSIPMNAPITVELAYNTPANSPEIVVTLNNDEYTLPDGMNGTLLSTDVYNFAVASYGITQNDFGSNGEYYITPVASTVSTSFSIDSICGEAPATFVGYGHEEAPVAHEHVWGEWVITAPATCTSVGLKTRTCSVCGETETEVIPATGVHTWGEWVTTTKPTPTDAGVKTHTCSVCGATETEEIAAGLYYDSVNYTFTLHNAAGLNYIRYAPDPNGVLTTTGAIKNAEGMVAVRSTYINANRTADGELSFEVINGGVYSFWFRFDSGAEVVLTAVDINNFLPAILSKDGPKLEIGNLYGVKDFFLVRGHVTSYNEIKNGTGRIVRYTNTTIGTRKVINYGIPTHALDANNEYTLYVRYEDTKKADYYVNFSLELPEPELTVNGLRIWVTGLEGLKTIRTAPGHLTTTNAIKNAVGTRNFSAKSFLSGGRTEMGIQYRTDGEYSLACVYKNGYEKIFNFTIHHLEPTIVLGDHSITFGDLDQLDIIRYAPGHITEPGSIKTVAGARYLKAAAIDANGEITITGLQSGEYTFLVQYTEESQNMYYFTFE